MNRDGYPGLYIREVTELHRRPFSVPTNRTSWTWKVSACAMASAALHPPATTQPHPKRPRKHLTNTANQRRCRVRSGDTWGGLVKGKGFEGGWGEGHMGLKA